MINRRVLHPAALIESTIVADFTTLKRNDFPPHKAQIIAQVAQRIAEV
jgi:hypothetical protein